MLIFLHGLWRCAAVLSVASARCRCLRVDTLAQILSIANVQAWGRYLVVDDVNGLLVSAVLERLGGTGLRMAQPLARGVPMISLRR
ncbi:MAG: Gcd10p family-domain-containing protein [Olpidium bornovanus]|uniref:tRNA (adenine(58)-N(1))-methyltransferase non-catalytic subunit TRM6 n=1 Tax=Olpidium bornovanus TaxID=278681 RepID=A0A8H7ZQT5_9FUNG|nr:MAG: Gcd10p family-domain-containing protein [Olpidium bornovanus]